MTDAVVVVGVACELEDADIARIEALDPRIEVRRITREQLADEATTLAAVAEIEVLLTFWGGRWQRTADLATLAPRLRWVQLASAGGDAVLHMLDRGVTFTTAAGVNASVIAECVLTYMLIFAKRWPEALRHQQAHEYTRFMPGEIAGATVGIVGFGHIGAEVAKRVRVLGCRVLATRRSLVLTAGGATPHPDVDEMLPSEALPRLLAESDYLVLAAPLTAETRNLIDAAALRAMQRSAVLINVSRGELVDEPALIEALRDGTIAGAALDVTVQEPLPPESPLWDLPNVVLTPHISGIAPHHFTRVTDIFLDNLRRYLAAEPLANRIDAARGY